MGRIALLLLGLSATSCASLWMDKDRLHPEANDARQYRVLVEYGAARWDTYKPTGATFLAIIPGGAPAYLDEERPFWWSVVGYPVLVFWDLGTAGSRASVKNEHAVVRYYESGPGEGLYCLPCTPVRWYDAPCRTKPSPVSSSPTQPVSTVVSEPKTP